MRRRINLEPKGVKNIDNSPTVNISAVVTNAEGDKDYGDHTVDQNEAGSTQQLATVDHKDSVSSQEAKDEVLEEVNQIEPERAVETQKSILSSRGSVSGGTISMS